MLAVIGGPEVNQLFLDALGCFDAFHLSRVADVRLPGGVPVFPDIGPDRTPEDVLAAHGLKPGSGAHARCRGGCDAGDLAALTRTRSSARIRI